MWQEYEDSPDDFYGKIIKRAKDSLPEISIDDNRFVIPEVDSRVQGNRTFFRNFKEIATQLNRQVSHFLKYITNELGTAGNVQSGQAVFQGKHNKIQINKLLDRYVQDFVLCPECNKPETRFISQGRVMVMKCDACGASSALRSVG